MTGLATPTRRELVAGLAAATAGCSHERVPFLSAEVPPLAGAWLEVAEDRSSEFVLLFDGDVETLLGRAPVSREDLVDVSDEKDVDLTFGPVDIEVPDAQLPGAVAEVRDDNTVTGRIDDFAITNDWPVHTWYSTIRVYYAEELPEEARAPLYISFPDGYQYELPADHETVKQRYDESGLFDYEPAEGGSTIPTRSATDVEPLDPERTFPSVQHYSHPDLVGMRLAAEYRYRAIEQSYDLFTWEYYEDQMEEAIRDAVTELMGELGRAAVEQVVLSPVPHSLSAASDVKSAHDALQADLPALENALNSMDTAAVASVNQDWMQDLAPRKNNGDDDKDGLFRLAKLAEREFEYRNPTLTTTNENEAFVDALEAYRSLIANQRAITARLLDQESMFMSTRGVGDEFERLHEYARTLLWESDRLLRAGEKALRELESDLPG